MPGAEIAAIIVIIACWGFCGWSLLVVAVTILAAVTDPDIN